MVWRCSEAAVASPARVAHGRWAGLEAGHHVGEFRDGKSVVGNNGACVWCCEAAQRPL